MSAENKNGILRFGVIFTIVIAGCLFAGCEVNSIEQSKTNTNTNSAVNQPQRLNFVASNSNSNEANSNEANSNKANSNSILSNANDAANENINNQTKAETSEIAQTVSTEFDSAKKSPTDSQFDSAAEQNQNLARNLTWTFGGKTQTGWYLYKPLICHEI